MDHAILQGRRILVAEDNGLIAIDLAFSLRDAGAEVVGPFPDARTALAAALEDGIAGAVLDVNLADGIVTPVAEALFARNVPCIFCTGIGLPPELAARLADPTVFQKPCDTTRVAAVMAGMIAARDGAD